MKTRTYKGFAIRDWTGPYGSYPDAGEPRYFVQTKHDATGVDNSPELCPKAWSLGQARHTIDMMTKLEADK